MKKQVFHRASLLPDTDAVGEEDGPDGDDGESASHRQGVRGDAARLEAAQPVAGHRGALADAVDDAVHPSLRSNQFMPSATRTMNRSSIQPYNSSNQ